MFKKAGWMATIAAAGLFFSSAAVADMWRFALEEVEGSVQHTYAQEFKKRVEERSGGDITIEIYPYGSLGSSPQLTALIKQDAIQLAFASPGHLASVIPEVGVFTLHFLLSDDNEINEQVLANSGSLPLLQEAYHEQGLRLLGFIPEGWMVWTANRAIETPADMEGFKIRTMTSPILAETYGAYSAEAEPLPYSEVYSGLRSGQIEGQVNPIFAIEEMSFYEVQSHMIQAKPAQFITSLVAAQGFYENLSDEQKAMIGDVTGEMRSYVFDKQDELNQKRLEILKENNDIEMITLTEEQRNAFREKSLPVRDLYIEQAGERGKKILETLDQELRAEEKEKGGGASEDASISEG